MRRASLLCVVAICSGALASPQDVETCLAQADETGASACRAHAQSIRGDVNALFAFGQSLEQAGRQTHAVAVYSMAVAVHPGERTLLQGLIRARRAAKTLALVGAPTPRRERAGPDDTQSCHAKRWHYALPHCQAAIAKNSQSAVLHERHADVLRSLGRTAEAVDAYTQSLSLDPGNTRVERKRRALTELAGDASPSTAQKLELLKDLLTRGLIDAAEFEHRRGKMLGTALGAAPDLSVPLDTAPGKYHALIIGNDRYHDFIELQTPQADARSVAALLRNRYGFATRTLLNAGRYEILRALSDVRREVGENDSLLIYYAGHGFLDPKTKRGYWLPVDAERDNFANWISTADVTDALAGVSARHAIVVADSCFSGTLLRDMNLPPVDSRAQLLEHLASKRSRTVLTSGGLEPVLDGGGGTHSVFARVFLDALRENQGVLEAGRLFVTLRDRVTQNANQTPQYAPLRNVGHEGGDFIFIRRH